jgi:hypothetical protein
MAPREHFLARLLEMPRIEDPGVRRGIFRQTITALGLEDASGGPLALAGVEPKSLGRSVQVAFADGLIDHLDFIAPAAAAVALYQIANALPLSAERRAIGRKVLGYLWQGNAETFASLAARMALGSTKPLEGAGVRARVALALELHSGSAEAATDRLALAIVTRRELAARWIGQAATGSLPDRRFAAKLIERAAREAARRATAGDTHPLRIFEGVVHPARRSQLSPPRPDTLDAVARAWHTLLADRETLVWRHVGVARGLLCAAVPQFVDEIHNMLRPELSPTEWRRASTSLMARVAVDRGRGLADAHALLDGPLLKRDPGIAMSMVWGLGNAAEVEPEAADELLEVIASLSPISIADSLVDLRFEVPGSGGRAAEMCASALRSSLSRPELDDGLSALARSILQDLEDEGASRELYQTERAAVEAYGEHGADKALELARRTLEIATERVASLSELDAGYDAAPGTTETRRRAMELLRDIDATLLESRTLSNLLLLECPPGVEATSVEAVDDLDARLAHWLLDAKRRSATPEEVKTQATLHQRQLRTLLHLIDSASTDFGDDQERRTRVRGRWTLAVRAFVAHLRKQPNTRLTRAIIATIARACDALVRDHAAEPVDVFLYVASYLGDPAHMSIVAEASMDPDVTQLLTRYLEFAAAPVAGPASDQARARIAAFRRFLEAFPIQTTLRTEAFRTTAWSLVRGLESITSAGSLRALSPEDGATPLAEVEDAILQLGQLVVGAERRASDHVGKQAVRPKQHQLAHAVEGFVNTESESELVEALTATARYADTVLPAGIAQVVTQTLPRLAQLRIDRPSLPPHAEARSLKLDLPPWMPPRRIIGGFYVLHQLGGGNVGTVFVVKRAEERHDPKADRFALKVPEYNATAARTMSEAEFLRLFREEAGALLSIPEHRNIARFVTFDAGAKPKPILVMELIEGVSCERAVSSQRMTMELAVRVLDGVMAGLEAMHEAGIAHLDVKPSNAILREQGADPVLVDFGLAGRKIRPGCATLSYGAPEVWESTPATAHNGLALAADTYAFGCFAYEILTGQTLFDGTSDIAIISAHITHDGLPPQVQRMAQTPQLQPIAMLLYQCLRRDARQRPRMSEVRREFEKVRPVLAHHGWPLRG